MNILLYTGQLHQAGLKVAVESFGRSRVATVGTLNATNCAWDTLCRENGSRIFLEDGYVWNENGKKPALIHQFDRLEELNDVVSTRSASLTFI